MPCTVVNRGAWDEWRVIIPNRKSASMSSSSGFMGRGCPKDTFTGAGWEVPPWAYLQSLSHAFGIHQRVEWMHHALHIFSQAITSPL